MKRIRIQGEYIDYSLTQEWDNGNWVRPVPRETPYNETDEYGARYYLIPSDAMLEGL